MTQSNHAVLVDQMKPDQLIESERHRLLSSDRRRNVLTVLADHPRPISFDELVDFVCEQETSSELVDPDLRDEIEMSLHHLHLPMMDDFGLVDYVPSEKRIK